MKTHFLGKQGYTSTNIEGDKMAIVVEFINDMDGYDRTQKRKMSTKKPDPICLPLLFGLVSIQLDQYIRFEINRKMLVLMNDSYRGTQRVYAKTRSAQTIYTQMKTA